MAHIPQYSPWFKLKILTEGGRIIQKLPTILRVSRTCAQKSNFKNRIKNIASIQPALLEMIYQKLLLDSSIASHLDTVVKNWRNMQANLRHLNPRMPGDKYSVFFTPLYVLTWRRL